MCSKPVRADPAAELADKLAAAIDSLAVADADDDGAAGLDLASRLASAWAMIAAADPELAARAARYSRS